MRFWCSNITWVYNFFCFASQVFVLATGAWDFYARNYTGHGERCRRTPAPAGECPYIFFVIFNTRSDIGGVRDFLEVHKLERVLPIMVGTSLFENLNSMPCTGMLQHCTQPRIRRARYAHHVTSKFQHWRSARGLQHRVLCCSTRPGTVWSSKTPHTWPTTSPISDHPIKLCL